VNTLRILFLNAFILIGGNVLADVRLPSALEASSPSCGDYVTVDLANPDYKLLLLWARPDREGKLLNYYTEAVWDTGQINALLLFPEKVLQEMRAGANKLGAEHKMRPSTIFYTELFVQTFESLNKKGLVLAEGWKAGPLPNDKRWFIPVATVRTSDVDSTIRQLCKQGPTASTMTVERSELRTSHPQRTERSRPRHALKHSDVARTAPVRSSPQRKPASGWVMPQVPESRERVE
jgi:hypothetical protein